jgi:hypothetical protein
MPKTQKSGGIETALKILAEVDNLTSLGLHFDARDKHLKLAIPYITPILENSASTLLTLSLKIPVGAYDDLGATTLSFTALRYLSIHVFAITSLNASKSSGSASTDTTAVACFISSQKLLQTLRQCQ